MGIKIRSDITINQNGNDLGTLGELFPIVLYEDTNGTTGGITLNDNIDNYKYVEIESYCMYSGANVYFNTGKIPTVSKGRIHIVNEFIGVGGLDVTVKRIAISGTSLTVTSDRELYQGQVSDGNYTYITKILGYK